MNAECELDTIEQLMSYAVKGNEDAVKFILDLPPSYWASTRFSQGSLNAHKVIRDAIGLQAEHGDSELTRDSLANYITTRATQYNITPLNRSAILSVHGRAALKAPKPSELHGIADIVNAQAAKDDLTATLKQGDVASAPPKLEQVGL